MTAYRQTKVPDSELTYAEYMEAFDVEPATAQPYAILDGVQTFLNTPTFRHQRIVGSIYSRFRRFEEASGIGLALVSPFDVLIRRVPKLQTRQPDVMFVSHARLAAGGGVPTKGVLEVGPELVVEVLSPSETKLSMNAKLQDYQRIGVQECWLVNTASATVEVLRWTDADFESIATFAEGQQVASLVFAGLSLALADIFAP